MKIAVLGGGNMGSAFARGLRGSQPQELLIIERNDAKLSALREELQCHVLQTPSTVLQEYDMLFLAVKPNDAQELCAALLPILTPSQIVISFMSGLRLERLQLLLGGHPLIVRCMPNLPVSVSEGVIVMYSPVTLGSSEKERVQKVLAQTGVVLQVQDEALIDSATALTASGTGHAYYLIEAWLKSAQELGFSAEQSAKLIRHTLSGALALWEKCSKTLADLRRAVTSPGGTTARAHETFDRGGLPSLFAEGIRAAYRRAQELSRA